MPQTQQSAAVQQGFAICLPAPNVPSTNSCHPTLGVNATVTASRRTGI